MDLETFIVATSCLIDDALNTVLAGQRLRQRGPMPILTAPLGHSPLQFARLLT